MNKSEIKDFLEEYNNLLSNATLEFKGKFAALASPTLNKQETITFLYEEVVKFSNNYKRISKRQINEWFTLPMFVARLGYLFLKLIINSFVFRVKFIPDNCIYVRTWLVPRSIKDGVARDDYFNELIDDLNNGQNVIVGFQPVDYGKLLKKFRKVKKPANFIIPIGLLRLRDILSVFISYITTARIQVHKNYYYKGKDVRFLINNSLKKDYYNCRSFQAYIELSIAKKIKKCNPKIFIYIFENQAWENAYLFEFKGSNIRTIGYQSSGFSFRFLNFFPSALDSGRALFPNKILTVGDLYTETLIKYGHYPIPIRTFAALRFKYPVVNTKYNVQNPNEEIFKRILYAFPVHFYQYPKIMMDLIEVFGDSGIEVHLKFHPLFNNRPININFPKNFLRWMPDNSKSLKELYDVVLYNDNSFGIESLIEGVRSYEYQFGELYPETRMINFDCYNSTLRKDNLFLLKKEILTNKLVKRFNNFEISNYINKNYKPYNNSLLEVIYNE